MLGRRGGYWLAVLSTIVALAACGGGAGSRSPVPGGPSTPAVASPTVVASPSPAATPGSTPGAGGKDAVTNPAVQAAVADLAQRRNVAPSQVQVVSVEAVEWPDGALGCPEPGRAYVQVITPGYRVVLSVNGQTVIYHTNQSGSIVKTCPGA